MTRWPLHTRVRDVLQSLQASFGDLPDIIHEQDRAHIIEWRPENFPNNPSPETIEDRLAEHEETLGDTLIRAETFDWGRCWVVHAAPEEDESDGG